MIKILRIYERTVLFFLLLIAKMSNYQLEHKPIALHQDTSDVGKQLLQFRILSPNAASKFSSRYTKNICHVLYLYYIYNMSKESYSNCGFNSLVEQDNYSSYMYFSKFWYVPTSMTSHDHIAQKPLLLLDFADISHPMVGYLSLLFLLDIVIRRRKFQLEFNLAN